MRVVRTNLQIVRHNVDVAGRRRRAIRRQRPPIEPLGTVGIERFVMPGVASREPELFRSSPSEATGEESGKGATRPAEAKWPQRRRPTAVVPMSLVHVLILHHAVVAARDADHLRTRLFERVRHCLADAAIGARDEGRLAGKVISYHYFISLTGTLSMSP